MEMVQKDAYETKLVSAAVAGDEPALERLLLMHHRRLAARIAPKLPNDLRGLVSHEDVLQDAFVEAFRGIRAFRPGEPHTFYHWLAGIAEHRLIDTIRAQRALKRGGGREPVDGHGEAWAGSLINLLLEVGIEERTPSRSAARHEALAAVQVALAGLKTEYRQVIRYRYIKSLPVAEVGRKMGRTSTAVAMLCRRALQALHTAMGRTSKYLSR